ncbi:unnamed protein product [Rotaria sordida]|uniref:Cytochrome c oxidase polypeptide II n=1 Tax=Rotaria sordida TaxID=392033 RepID=A0A815S8P0_9BILA|nr:unnamed protein product [Rotaria sordida]
MISCDEISCNRSATVICQKTPIITTHAVLAERDYTNFPISSAENESNSIRKNFILIFLICSIVFIVILVGFIYILYNRYRMRNNNRHHTGRFNNDPVYSHLLTRNELN